MPFALLIIGVVLLVAAARGTTSDLFGLVIRDFTGQNNFIYWVAAILVIGFIGYIPKVKPISVALLALVMLVLVLTKGKPGPGGGFFEKFTAGLGATQTPNMEVGKGTPNPSRIGGLGTVLEKLQPLTGYLQ